MPWQLRCPVACGLLASVATGATGGLEATDPQCPPASCCAGADGGEGGSGCFRHPFWTAAYCCARGPAAECYRWGEDAPGHDLVAYSLTSAVQCRHLCQASTECAYWTYLVDRPELREQRGRCYLKGPGALQARIAAHPFVVSGERLCAYFKEGLTAAEARARRGFQALRWHTAAGEAAAAAGPGYALLPAAGTSEWYLEAATVFATLGFVAVVDALNATQLQELRRSAKRIADSILASDPAHLGNRGPRRYSFGAASVTKHLMHMPAWPQLLDNERASLVMRTIFPDGYLATGGGGDFVLGGTSTYQSLHLDIGGGPIYEPGPPPGVAINYVLEDLSCADAPMRVLPGTQHLPAQPPTLPFEPEGGKAALLCPLPAGSAIVRDLRAWHGGTPSGSDRTRYLPNAEFVSVAWGSLTCGTGQILDPCIPVLPRAAHERLSPHGQAISAGIVDSSGDLERAAASGEWLIPDPVDFSRHAQEAY